MDRLELVHTKKGFRSQRATAQYIGVNIQLDIWESVQLIDPDRKEPTAAESKALLKFTELCKETKHQGLNYIPLDLESTRIGLLTDESFDNTANLKNQLGYLILLVDKEDKWKILHYGSHKWQRVARSVMAAELKAVVLAFKFAGIIKNLVEDILWRKLCIEGMIDRKTVFNVVPKRPENSRTPNADSRLTY